MSVTTAAGRLIRSGIRACSILRTRAPLALSRPEERGSYRSAVGPGRPSIRRTDRAYSGLAGTRSRRTEYSPKRRGPSENGRRLRPSVQICIYVVLVVVGATMAVPFVWMLCTSFKELGEVFTPEMRWLPERFMWSNYAEAVTAIPFWRMLFNSAFVAIVVTGGQVLTSSLAAFAFARLRFPGRDVLFFGYLSTMMVPGVVTMIPLFCLLRILGDAVPYEFFFRHWWLGRVVGGDSFFALIAPGLFSAYGTFMLRQFFLTVPRELDEAAVMDGCSKLGVYRHVVMPLSGPALATLAIFTFMWSWRDFMWPLIINNAIDMQTLPVGLASFQGLFAFRWDLLMAAAVLVMLPLIVVFAFCQRFFTEGIKLAGIKG